MIFNFIVKNLYVYFPGRNILFKFYLKHYAPPCTLCEVVLVSTWSMSQGITQDTETLTLDQLHLRSSSTPSAMCNQTSLNLTGDMFSLFIPILLNLGLKKSDEVRCIGAGYYQSKWFILNTNERSILQSTLNAPLICIK